MKRWQCTVCKYIHVGDSPPVRCPVCKVGSEKFVELPPEPGHDQEPVKEVPKRRPKPKPGGISGLIIKHHVHPMTVHVPNGVVPLVVLLIVIAVFSDLHGFAQSAVLCLAFVVLSLPFVWISGLVAWKNKYRGALTKIFKQKFISAAITTASAIGLLVWHILDPHAIDPGSILRWPILALNFVMLGATISAGFVGGKLVFKD